MTSGVGRLLASSAPLDPSGDEARRALRRELLRPDYVADDPVQRLLDALQRVIDAVVGSAQGAPPLIAGAVVVAILLLATAAVLLVSRARTTARERAAQEPALGVVRISADALRSRAEQALAQGRAEDALVDAFRATAVRQVERGRIADLPQATAHELAGALGAAFPEHAGDLARAADLFDAVLYGDRDARPEQARAQLDLDHLLLRSPREAVR